MPLLRKELIKVGLDCEQAEDVLRQMADAFLQAGLVRESFIEAVIAREKVYPTGLPAEAFDIAMPHTMAEHVITPAVGVGILRRPVDWRQMGSPEITLRPRLVFMLAISDPKDQLEQLKKIMKLIQNDDLLRLTAEAANPEAVMELLQPVLG